MALSGRSLPPALQNSFSWLGWPSTSRAGITRWNPPPGGHSQPLATASRFPLWWGSWTPGSSQDVESPVSEHIPGVLEFLWHRRYLYCKHRKNSFFMLFQLKTAVAGPQSGDQDGGGEWVCAAGLSQPPGLQVACPRCTGPRPGFLPGQWAWGMRASREKKRRLVGNVATSHLEKPKNTRWRAYTLLVRQPNMGH